MNLVVGHDGHPAAAAALRVAIELAERLHAQLDVVHCITVEDAGLDPDTEEFEEQLDRNIEHERNLIEQALSLTSCAWNYHEERGDPVSRLATLAGELDAMFIIVGSTHRGMFHQLTARSVSRRLVQMQKRPVLIVPEP